MPGAVDLVTVHHEGSGSPTDNPRGAHGGYTYWIGASYWSWLRSVWDSYATLNFNGESVDICLSGNRHWISPEETGYAVTDKDIQMIQGACQDARSRGYLTDNPTVRDHHHSPGSNTVCPGSHTMDRWPEVVSACQKSGGSTKPPPTQAGGAMDLVRTPSGHGYYIVAADGGVFCYGDARFYGSMGGVRLAAPVVDMAVKPQNDGYILVASDGGVFAFGNVKNYGNMVGKKHAPITGCDFDAEGDGYWLLAQDGGVFTFGKTSFYGSAAGKVKYP